MTVQPTDREKALANYFTAKRNTRSAANDIGCDGLANAIEDQTLCMQALQATGYTGPWPPVQVVDPADCDFGWGDSFK